MGLGASPGAGQNKRLELDARLEKGLAGATDYVRSTFATVPPTSLPAEQKEFAISALCIRPAATQALLVSSRFITPMVLDTFDHIGRDHFMSYIEFRLRPPQTVEELLAMENHPIEHNLHLSVLESGIRRARTAIPRDSSAVLVALKGELLVLHEQCIPALSLLAISLSNRGCSDLFAPLSELCRNALPSDRATVLQSFTRMLTSLQNEAQPVLLAAAAAVKRLHPSFASVLADYLVSKQPVRPNLQEAYDPQKFFFTIAALLAEHAKINPEVFSAASLETTTRKWSSVIQSLKRSGQTPDADCDSLEAALGA
ncbi:MAG: hypothetical protein J5J00_03660 [Deltaproteobacteria bacterium]|nr:hypothetical protein [Deltaproteobacteria bacterium]